LHLNILDRSRFIYFLSYLRKEEVAESKRNGENPVQKPSNPDLDLASNVQQLLFPKGSPACGWCCVGVKNRMARGLGGDFFDFVTMPDGCQLVFIGDVTGHGLHASVVMALLYGFIHRAVAKTCSPLGTVREINEFLQTFAVRSKKFDYFFSATLFFGVIDPSTLEMHYVNAGHVEPLVLQNGRVLALGSSAPPIGFFDDPEIELKSFSFTRGDRVLFFTDGLNEAMNDQGMIYGKKRLAGLLESFSGSHLELLDEIFDDLAGFGACNPPVDDCTAIVMDLHGAIA